MLKLSALTGRGDFHDLAESSLRLVADLSVRYPTAFGRWLSTAWFARSRVKQVALVTGGDADSTLELLNLLRSNYRPDLVLASSPHPPPAGAPELLQDRPLVNGRSTAYVCEGFVCLQPVTAPAELMDYWRKNETKHIASIVNIVVDNFDSPLLSPCIPRYCL